MSAVMSLTAITRGTLYSRLAWANRARWCLCVLQLCSAVHEHALQILEGQMMQQEALMSQLAQELGQWPPAALAVTPGHGV